MLKDIITHIRYYHESDVTIFTLTFDQTFTFSLNSSLSLTFDYTMCKIAFIEHSFTNKSSSVMWLALANYNTVEYLQDPSLSRIHLILIQLFVVNISGVGSFGIFSCCEPQRLMKEKETSEIFKMQEQQQSFTPGQIFKILTNFSLSWYSIHMFKLNGKSQQWRSQEWKLIMSTWQWLHKNDKYTQYRCHMPDSVPNALQIPSHFSLRVFTWRQEIVGKANRPSWSTN